RHGRLPHGGPPTAPRERPPRRRLPPAALRERAHRPRGGARPLMSVTVSEVEPPDTRQRGTPLLKLEGIKKHFPITRGIIFQKKIGQVHAVDGVDLEIYPGETLGLVGETGCGKSTLARVVMRLYDVTEGTILFEGEDITHVKGRRLRELRRNMQIIFQEPYEC